jgi:hypothetical protein
MSNHEYCGRSGTAALASGTRNPRRQATTRGSFVCWPGMYPKIYKPRGYGVGYASSCGDAVELGGVPGRCASLLTPHRPRLPPSPTSPLASAPSQHPAAPRCPLGPGPTRKHAHTRCRPEPSRPGWTYRRPHPPGLSHLPRCARTSSRRTANRAGQLENRVTVNPDQARAYSVSGQPAVADPAAHRANVDPEELGGLAGGTCRGSCSAGRLSEVPGKLLRFVSGRALSSIPKGRQVSGVSRSVLDQPAPDRRRCSLLPRVRDDVCRHPRRVTTAS